MAPTPTPKPVPTPAPKPVTPPAPASAPTLVSRFLAKFKTEIGNLVSHAVALAGAYAVVAHTDFTKLETAIAGAVAVAIGAITNKLRHYKL